MWGYMRYSSLYSVLSWVDDCQSIVLLNGTYSKMYFSPLKEGQLKKYVYIPLSVHHIMNIIGA